MCYLRHANAQRAARNSCHPHEHSHLQIVSILAHQNSLHREVKSSMCTSTPEQQHSSPTPKQLQVLHLFRQNRLEWAPHAPKIAQTVKHRGLYALRVAFLCFCGFALRRANHKGRVCDSIGCSTAVVPPNMPQPLVQGQVLGVHRLPYIPLRCPCNRSLHLSPITLSILEWALLNRRLPVVLHDMPESNLHSI